MKVLSRKQLLALPYDKQLHGLKDFKSVLVVPTSIVFDEMPKYQWFVLVGCDKNGDAVAKVGYCDVLDIEGGHPLIDVLENGITRIHDMEWRKMNVLDNSSATIIIDKKV